MAPRKSRSVATATAVVALTTLAAAAPVRIFRTAVRECDPSYPYRTYDGTCNNLNRTAWGSPGQPFFRPEQINGYLDQVAEVPRLPPRLQTEPCGYFKPEWTPPLYRENPRCISNLFQQPTVTPPDPNLNTLLVSYGQFVMHDTVLNRQLCYSGDTPCFGINGIRFAVHPPDVLIPTYEGQEPNIIMNPNIFGLNNGVKAALNNVTAWLDLSSLYGFDNFTVVGMRHYQGGRIKFLAEDDSYLPRLADINTVDDTPPWPFGRNNTFGAGDPRAFNNVILGAITTLWHRVHTYFADKFTAEHPEWDDERTFQEARKWTTALHQHITYNEFLPTLMGAAVTNIPPYKGYNPEVNPEPSYSYVNGVFRSGHSGVTEFVEFRRANGEIQDVIGLAGQTPALIEKGARSTIDYFTRRGGIEIVLRGALAQPANKFDQFMADSMRSFRLPALLGAGVDIIAQGIYRGRDSGSLTYDNARIRWGLPSLYTLPGCQREADSPFDTIECFNYLTTNATLATELRRLYFQIGNVDMDVGATIEPDYPGSPLGELTVRIVADQFARLRDGDRFWYQNENQFTPAELEEIQSVTLASLLLSFTSIDCVPSNPFYYTASPVCKGDVPTIFKPIARSRA